MKPLSDLPVGKHANRLDTGSASDARAHLPDPFPIVEREHERDALRAAVDCARTGEVAAVMVSGAAGIGKSALVQSVKADIGDEGVWFVSGKFVSRVGAPGQVVFAAIDGVIEWLLALPEDELEVCRARFEDALGENIAVLFANLPALRTVMVGQSSAASVYPEQSSSRFLYVFSRLVRVLCRIRSMIIFMDDLQWADALSLQILETLADRDNSQSLLLIGAYRDTEADKPVLQLERSISAQSSLTHLKPDPLSVFGLTELLRGMFGATRQNLSELAEVVHRKTLGNPLAVKLLLHRLCAENLLTQDEENAWRWDAAGVLEMNVDRDVAEELVGRMRRLDLVSARVLGTAAILGFDFTIEQLTIALSMTFAEVEAALAGGLKENLLVELPGYVQFHHDRIRDAALAHLVDSGVEDPGAAHAMGLRLLKAQPFDRNWLSWLMLANRGVTPDQTTAADCRLLVDLNVRAASEIKPTGAAAQAWEYAQAALSWLAKTAGAGTDTLRDQMWREDKTAARAAIAVVAESAYLAGAAEAAHELVAELLAHADGLLEEIPAHEISINTKVGEGQLLAAVEDAFDLLARLEMYTPDADEEGLGQAIVQLDAELASAGITGLGEHSMRSLLEGPQMHEPGYLAAMRIVASLIAPLYISAIERMSQLAMACLRLMLRHGWCPETSFILVVYALVLLRVRKTDRAAELGQLGMALLERDRAQTNKAKSRVFYDWSVRCWRDELRDTVPVIRRDYELACQEGEPVFGAVAALFEGVHQFIAGDDLNTVSHTMTVSAQAMVKLSQQSFTQLLAVWRQTVFELQNRVSSPVVFRGPYLDELEMVEQLEQAGNRAALFHLYYNKLTLAYLFDAPAAELEDLLAELETYWAPGSGWAIAAMMLFYPSLARLRIAEAKPAGSKEALRLKAQVATDQRQLSVWSVSAPVNFAHRYHLVQAELDRLQGYVEGAQNNFRLAVDLAQQHRCAQDEGLALELAAKFHANQNALYEAVNDVGAALRVYQAWGAQAKVRHTAARHGAQDELSATRGGRSDTDKSAAADRAFLSRLPDMVTQPSSVRGSLVELMKLTLESLSTDKVAVFMQGHTPEVILCQRDGDAVAEYWYESAELAIKAGEIVGSVYRKVRRTGMMTVISSEQDYGVLGRPEDTAAALPKSVMCAPIAYQGETLGFLYLANLTISGIYVPSRVSAIEQMVAFYGVILGNLAHLNAARREQQLLHNILQAAPDATLLLAADNHVMYANIQAEELWGADKGGLVDLTAIELVPTNQQLPLARHLRKARVSAPRGTLHRNVRRLDGAEVPAELRISGIARDPGLLIVTVRDISERLQAQQEIDVHREELARMSRIATIGALSSSLTHEVAQPVAAILSNAQAGELLLNQPKPDPHLLEAIFGDVVGEAKRVRQVIANLRRLQSNESMDFERQNVNELVKATITLIRGELRSQGFTLELDLANDLPEIEAAEIGLQQVLLNLLTNAMQSCRDVEPARRMIKVKSGLDQSGVLIGVSDLGEGIAEEAAARLFQPFFTSKQDGLGVGLMICQRIVEEHGGRIWFENNASRGATFFVWLPLQTTS